MAISVTSSSVSAFPFLNPEYEPSALTASNASAVDLVYAAEEQAVIENLRIRVNELETKLRDAGLLV